MDLQVPRPVGHLREADQILFPDPFLVFYQPFFGNDK
jgi:hypothetical protein